MGAVQQRKPRGTRELYSFRGVGTRVRRFAGLGFSVTYNSSNQPIVNGHAFLAGAGLDVNYNWRPKMLRPCKLVGWISSPPYGLTSADNRLSS